MEHRAYFDLQTDEILTEDQFNREQHFLIVTDGTGFKTRKAIRYWKSQGLTIDSVIYRVYLTTHGESLIEFGTYSPSNDVLEQESSCYVVNTNYKNNQNAHMDMLTEGKAAAYFDPWKKKIKRIEPGDKVFLYQSGVGIVAIGIGTGKVESFDYQGHNDEEYSMKLNSFQQLRIPLTAAKMKSITESGFSFYQTMFSIG